MTFDYDFAVIGSGPGGYVAAIRAAQLGMKVICFDKRPSLGGTCLNVGCIPSKALLESTELLKLLKEEGKDHGYECIVEQVNVSKISARRDHIVRAFTQGVADIFQKDNIEFMQGAVEFIDSHHLKVVNDSNETLINAKNILISTGSEAAELPMLPFDERQVITSTKALKLLHIPKRMIVIGAGAVGVELGSIYQRLGCDVTIIEKLDRICPHLDMMLARVLLQSLKKQGIKFELSSTLLQGIIQPDEVILTVSQGEVLKNFNADVVLVAVGRKPFTEGLHLERIEVQKDSKGFISVDNTFRTSCPNVYAIGDVIEGPMLAHRSSEEGMAVVEWIHGGHPIVNYLAIPTVVYTDPEAAGVGVTEEEIRVMGIECKIGVCPFKSNPRAHCLGKEEGLVKVIGEARSGKLLGMHIIGPGASELISVGVLAIKEGITLERIGESSFPHPTLSEAIKEAALNAMGRAIHL